MNCRRCGRELEEQEDRSSTICRLCSFDAPYRHLLNTNTIPSGSERELITEQLLQQRKELSDIDQEVLNLNGRLRRLKLEQTTRRKRLELYQAAASPVRYLPDDIWGAIFEDLILEDDSKRIRRTLMEVCSRWRNFILNTPIFWNNIVVDYSASWEVAKAAFASTGSIMPLNVTIDLDSRRSFDDLYEFPSFDWMRDYIGRIQTLVIAYEVPNMPWGSAFNILHSITFQNLDDAQLPFYASNRVWDTPINAPLLRRATFKNVSSPLNYPIPWHQLTHLTIIRPILINAPTLFNCLDFLSQSLEILVLDHPSSGRFGHAQVARDEHIIFPRLSRLEISLQMDDDVRWLLNASTTPMLNCIALGRTGASIWAESVKALVERSSAPLRTAHLIDSQYETLKIYQMNPGEIIAISIAILSNLPSVSTIKVDTDRIYTNTLVNALEDHTLTNTSRYFKTVYQRSLSGDQKLDALKHEERVKAVSREPAVVLARSDKPITNINKVEKYRDVRMSTADIRGQSEVQRIDIYF